MSEDANRRQVSGPLLRQQVIALCDDQDEVMTVNSLELGRSWDFIANRSSSVIQYTLSITVAQDVVVYVRFTSNEIASLKKRVINRKEGSQCLDISRHLDNHQVFTRLQFQLSRNRELITPKEFDPVRCKSQAQTIFQIVALLSTVPSFSLYMPVDSLPKAIYQELYEDYRQCFRVADIQSMYNGKGGFRFDLAQYRSGIVTDRAVATTVNIDRLQCLLPSQKPSKGVASPSPTSQQSTVSASDATVAATTPSAYNDAGRNEDGDNPAPPPYSNGIYIYP